MLYYMFVLDVLLYKVNRGSFHNSYFSESSYVPAAEAVVQKCSVKMLLHGITLVSDHYGSKVTGINYVILQ